MRPQPTCDWTRWFQVREEEKRGKKFHFETFPKNACIDVVTTLD
jgi:hypothetical protein